MADIVPNRVTAKIDGDFVVFLIGMRINNWFRPSSWLPTLRAMGPMLDELTVAGPASGLLHFEQLGRMTIIQYWRSFEQLEAYARAEDMRHWPAWVDFNRRLKNRRGDVGIWHETYLVRSGEYEAIYSGMPSIGLAKAGLQAQITEGTGSARQRLGAS